MAKPKSQTWFTFMHNCCVRWYGLDHRNLGDYCNKRIETIWQKKSPINKFFLNAPKWPSSYYTFKTTPAKTTSSTGTPPPSSMHLCHCIPIIEVWWRKTIQSRDKHPTGKPFTTLTNKSLRTTAILTGTWLTLHHQRRGIYCSLPHWRIIDLGQNRVLFQICST